MLRVTLIVVSIGLADSIGPATIGPALYLATRRHARWQVAEFAIGIVAVNMAAGALIALGPGQFLLSLVPSPSPIAEHVTEVVIGSAIIVGAAVVWWYRASLARRQLPAMTARTGPGLVLGAGRALLGLPTAFPYFAAIAVIVASGVGVPQQASLLLLYNAAFVAPVIAIFVVLIVFGSRADGVLTRASDWVQRNWPPLLAALALVVGLAILGLGVSGLVGQ